MDIGELPELPEFPSQPGVEYMRTLRLSLVEDSEKFAIDKIRSNHEHGNNQAHIEKHHHGLDSEYGDKHDSNLKNNKKQDQQGYPDPSEKNPNAPKDKGYFVLIVLGLFGLVHMLPFIFIFQANEFWMYKFRNTTDGAEGRTYLQANFFSLAKVALTVPGVICTFIAAIAGHKVKAQTRIFSVLFIHSVILITNLVFVNINTDGWQKGYFILVVGLEIIMAGSMSLGGSGSMGLISKLPRRYMKAELVGEGASSIFSALLRLISIFATPSTTDAAFIYFSAGAALMAGTSIIFYFATQTTFFKFYTKNHKEERKEKFRNVGDFMGVLKILWPVLLLNVVPLIDPSSSLGGLVESEFKGKNAWGDQYFVTICCYLLPAVTGVIGRLIFNYMDYDSSIPMLAVLVLSREIFFGAAAFLTNAQPRSHLPVIIKHDWQFALVNVGNSITSGFTSNLMAIKTMRMVPQDRIELSMMCNMFFTSAVVAITSPLGILAVTLI